MCHPVTPRGSGETDKVVFENPKSLLAWNNLAKIRDFHHPYASNDFYDKADIIHNMVSFKETYESKSIDGKSVMIFIYCHSDI